MRFLPGQNFLPHLAARQVELPFDQLDGHQPMIAAFGLSDFRQLGVEPLFAKAVGRLDPPAVNNRLVPLPGDDDLIRFAVVSHIPMSFGRLLARGVNPRADQQRPGSSRLSCAVPDHARVAIARDRVSDRQNSSLRPARPRFAHPCNGSQGRRSDGGLAHNTGRCWPVEGSTASQRVCATTWTAFSSKGAKNCRLP